jgi:DNA-binding CsgD family transcriptional regulator
LDELSAREREVFARLADGQSNRQIALGLRISVRTVEAHRAQVCAKLDIRSVAELTKLAIREGITMV